MHNLRDRRQAVRREVYFDPIFKIRSIPSLDDGYTASDRSSIWYKRSDFEFMRIHIKITLSVIRRNELDAPASEEYCSRGLERSLNKDEQQERRQKKHIAALTVILEQRRQESRNICNPQIISNHYMNESKACVFAAHKRGLKDEREAMLAYAMPSTSDQSEPYTPMGTSLPQLCGRVRELKGRTADETDPPLSYTTRAA
jgi:hypothetical protein